MSATVEVSAGAAGAKWPTPVVAWYGVTMICAVTIFGQIDRAIMPLLVGPIKKDLHLSDVQVSLLMGAAYSAVYLLGGIPIARISDSRRRTFILPMALALWSLGTALCGIAQGFWQFFLFRGLLGGGECVKAPASASLIPDLVPRQKLGRAFAVYNIAVMGGDALGLILGGLLLGWLGRHVIALPWLGHVHSWQMVYFIFGIPGMVLAIWFALTVREPARQGLKRVRAPLGEVALFVVRGPASRVLVPILLSAAISGIYLVGVGSWRPQFYERTYGIGPHTYGPIVGLGTLIVSPIGVILGSWLIERMARVWDDAHMRLVVIVHLIILPVQVLGPLAPNFQLALACQLFPTMMLMISAPAQLAAMQIITPNEMRAQVNAVYMVTVGVIGQGLGPTVVASITQYLFKDEAALRYAMMSAGAVATPLMLLCLIQAVRPFGRLHREAIEAEAAARP